MTKTLVIFLLMEHLIAYQVEVYSNNLLQGIGYQEVKDYFSPVFYALMNKKSENAYKILHQQVKLLNNKFSPSYWTLDFEMGPTRVKF